MTPTPSAGPAAGRRPGAPVGSRRGTVLLVLAAGLAGVAVGSSTWATARTTSVLGVDTVIDVSGRVVAPGVVAGGLVVAAAALALALTGPVAGRAAALAVVAAGALEVWSALEGVQGVERAAAVVARREVGVDVLTTAPVTSVAPWLAVGVGTATALVGLVAFVRAPRWAAARLAADAATAPRADRTGDPAGLDEAGRDPGLDRTTKPDRAGGDVAGGDVAGGDSSGGGSPDGAVAGSQLDGRDDLDEHDAWDALSRGEDPS